MQLQGQGSDDQESERRQRASRYVGFTAFTMKTRSSEARMNAPATSPVRNGYSTIRTLHWSSTSFGYMKPSTGICNRSSLSHRAIQAVVKQLGAGGQVRF